MVYRGSLKSFPDAFDDYQKNKHDAKLNLQPHMKMLAEKLQEPYRIEALFNKAMFNGGEVNYLTVKHNGIFHIFHSKDVVDIFSEKLKVENSKGRSKGQYDAQKVIFKYNNKNLAELEMRNDSKVHYREIRFNMLKQRAMELLLSSFNAETKEELLPNLIVYGSSIKKFGKWFKSKTI